MKTKTSARKFLGVMALGSAMIAGAPIDSLGNTLPAVVAYVTATGTYSDGSIYVFFDKQISSCNPSGRLDISAGHPALKNIQAIAITAFAAGKAVRIHPGSCSGTTPVFTLTGDSYFYLTTETP